MGLADGIKRVDDHLSGALEALREPRYPGELWAHAVELVSRLADQPSSGLRPGLVLTGYGAVTDAIDDRAVAFAAGVELYHLFMLVYDDVMDQGSVRRGLPAVHRAMRERVENGTADQLTLILASVLQNRANRLLAGADPDGRALARILDSGLRAGVAEFHNLLGWGGSALGSEAVARFLADKGGDHSVAAPLAAGMLLARPDADTAAAEVWGHHAGVAFQAFDDLRDIVALPHEVGKDLLQDVRQGRVSLITHLLTEALGYDAARRLCRGSSTPMGRRAFFVALAEHQIVERGCRFVRKHVELARAHTGLQPALHEPLAELLTGFDVKLAALESRLAEGWLRSGVQEAASA